MTSKQNQQQFGGDWTVEKLERIRKYLAAYVQALKKQNFQTVYIDAFAGTGYNTAKQESRELETVISELTEQDTKKFLDGSARIALQIQPPFSKYIFIEKSQSRFAELEKLRIEFPERASSLALVNEDANTYISICFVLPQNIL